MSYTTILYYFILKQTPESEIRYKKYNNKLTLILRLTEETWSILNRSINRNSVKQNIINDLKVDGNEISNKQQMCKEFNDFFT